MDVKCYNKKCLYIWDYRGENKRHICCPKCRFKRILDKCIAFFLDKSDIISDIPKNRPNDILFETIKDKDGFVYLVDKKIARQFKEALEEIEPSSFQEQEQEQESAIKILPSKFKIIRIIPRDPIKILEHQQEYGLGIVN